MSDSSRPAVFLGPTLPVDEARRLLDADYLPPVQLGDVWRISQEHPTAIGIVDGYFHSVPAVWHKEILYAMSVGIPVYGASSMGALRYAELAPFGMIGVGTIARAYAAGTLVSDDEVVLAHGTAEDAYRPYSEPLVNIRATVGAALEAAVLTTATGSAVIELARSLFYPDRIWKRLSDEAVRHDERHALVEWLPRGRVDQKRRDAVALLERIARDGSVGPAAPPSTCPPFTRTVLWEELIRAETPIGSILEEFLLVDQLAPAVRDALARSADGGRVDWLAVLSAEPDWPERCRRARAKATIVETLDVAPLANVDAVDGLDDLIVWFLGERLAWPDDLGGFLRDRGWTDTGRLAAVARREAALVGRQVR